LFIHTHVHAGLVLVQAVELLQLLNRSKLQLQGFDIAARINHSGSIRLYTAEIVVSTRFVVGLLCPPGTRGGTRVSSELAALGAPR